MTDICRLCASLKTLDMLCTIGDPNLSIKNKLARCCQIVLPQNDEFLPQNVCNDCVLSLNNSWQFAEKVVLAQDTLRQAFSVNFSTNEGLLKNEIEQKNHQQHMEEERLRLEQQQIEIPFQYPSQSVVIVGDSTTVQVDQQADTLEPPHCSKRKKKQPTKLMQDINDQSNKVQIISEMTRKPTDLPLKIRSIIISLHLKGYAVDEICKRLNVDQEAVVMWLETYKSHCSQNSIVSLAQQQELQPIEEEILDTEDNETIIKIEIPSMMSSERPDNQQILEMELDKSAESNSYKIVNNLTEFTISLEDSIEYSAESNEEIELHSQIELPANEIVQEELQASAQNEEICLNEEEEEAEEEEVVEIEQQLQHDNEPIHYAFDPDNNVEVSDEEILYEQLNYSDSDENQLNLSDADEPPNYLCLTDDAKNDDGTINQGCDNYLRETWLDYPWNCSCGQTLPSVKDLRSHYAKEHKTHAKYVCVDCCLDFNKFLTFVNHVRMKHRPLLRYCCDICSVYYWNQKQLTEHRAAHRDTERSFVCQKCGKGFRSSSTLQVHCYTHLPNDVKNKYKCDICHKKFGTKPNLTAHKRIHAGVRDYTCDQCGKSFVQKGNLDNHMLTHVPNKPFKCDICRKSFKTQLRLLKHNTVHTGFKPHKCEHCGREFREKGTLREHIRIHTGAMPFTCDYCGKKFRFKGVLTTHRRQHTGERPYSCVECDHHFTNWPNYNKHMKRRHGINTSVTVRKPQAIPPSGMPAKAKLNHVVPTVDNVVYIPQTTSDETSSSSQPADTPTTKTEIASSDVQIETNQDINCSTNNGNNDDEDIKLVSTNNDAVVQQQQEQTTTGTILTNVIGQPAIIGHHHHHQHHHHDLTNHGQNAQIKVLTHPTRGLQQVLSAATPIVNGGQPHLTQFSYIQNNSTGMLGFYNLQNVDVDLMQNVAAAAMPR